MQSLYRAMVLLLAACVFVSMVAFPTNVVGRWLGDVPQQSNPGDALSPHWDAGIQQWGALIMQEATRRGLDPDFLAALVQMESSGDPNAIGPKGAVGLMQVMPKEAGFSWRPTQAELLDPATNLFWGARTLSTVVHQGKGDVFNSLAAYNGGWDRVSNQGPTRFSTIIMRDYAAAVAERNGVRDRWVAFFAIWDATAHGPIWVADFAREDVYFYGQSNWVPEGAALIPLHPPTTVVAQCLDETTGQAYAVGLWLYVVSQNWWVGSIDTYLSPATAPTPLASPLIFATPTGTLYPTSTYVPADVQVPGDVISATITATLELSPTPALTITTAPTPTLTPTPTLIPTLTPTPTPTPAEHTPEHEPSVTPTPTTTPTVSPTPTPTSRSGTSASVDAVVREGGAELRPGATRWWDPVEVLSAGTEVRLLGEDPDYPEWVYVSTFDDKLFGWTQIENLDIGRKSTSLPVMTPRPTLTASPTPSLTPTPTPTLTPKPKIACNGEPLFAEAWQMEKYNTIEGWETVIFARGHEGTCSYTYAWDSPDNVIAGPTNESVMFVVKSAKRMGDLAGSVIVSDGNETVTIGIFVTSPENDP